MKNTSSERCSAAEARIAAHLFPFSRREIDQGKRASARMVKVVPRPLIHQLGRRSLRATGQALRLAHTVPVRDFLAAAAFLALWAVLAWLLAFGVLFPLGEALALAPAIDGSTRVVRPPRSCLPGTVEFDGLCVLGEEIVVKPPPGWARR